MKHFILLLVTFCCFHIFSQTNSNELTYQKLGFTKYDGKFKHLESGRVFEIMVSNGKFREFDGNNQLLSSGIINRTGDIQFELVPETSLLEAIINKPIEYKVLHIDASSLQIQIDQETFSFVRLP